MSIERLKSMGFDHYDLAKEDPDYYFTHRKRKDGSRSYKVIERKTRYKTFSSSTREFLLRLYGSEENYIYSCFNPKFDGYVTLEDAILLYESSLVNTASAYLVIKKLEGGYLDDAFEPSIAARDLIDKVISDPSLIEHFTKTRYTF